MIFFDYGFLFVFNKAFVLAFLFISELVRRQVVKKKKDPNAPKRPAGGAYGCFLAKHRAAFMEQLKGQPVSAVTKLASAKWKELAATEKEVYEQEFKKKQEAYQEAMIGGSKVSNGQFYWQTFRHIET